VAQLIAILSSGKGTWTDVLNLIQGDWDQVYLLCSDFAYKTVDINQKNILKLMISEENPQEYIKKLSDLFKIKLKSEFDVALNISSGSGMEHMIVMSSILKAGVGVRFVYSENKEVKEFNLLDESYSNENLDEF